MDLKLNTACEIKKTSFTLKPKALVRNGLILRVHHTKDNSQRLRFLHTCFNSEGDLVASSDNKGNIFFINIRSCKFWGVPLVNSCTFLSFSSFKTCEILVGQKTNEIIILNFENGNITAKLQGHETPPSIISFSSCIYCLTSSVTEAIIWNLQDNTKLKKLSLNDGSMLLHVSFMPNSNLIIGCYMDSMLNVWQVGTFEIIRTISASTWNNMTIKNVALSNDYLYIGLSGIDSCVAIYSLKAWKVIKFINLPGYIKTIRLLRYISLNKPMRTILAILSGNGVLSFVDLMDNTIISELKTQNEIVSLDHSDLTLYLSCLLCTGEIEIYDITMYVETPVKVTASTEKKMKSKTNNDLRFNKAVEVREEVDEILNVDKLRSILREYGEYPENYRIMIWDQLLQLPHNKAAYGAMIKCQLYDTFENLYEEHPIDNRSLKSLRCLLNNLVTWCEFFAHVHYLPVLVYPFVKVFQNRPMVCFEAVATILLNWCQYWFEYFPLPPVNILAIIENMMLEWDPQLLQHLSNHGITSKQYAWPLLESAFSEVLTSNSWFAFWDNVLTNEPSFLLCTIVGYNIIQRKVLLNLKETKEIENFYHKQNPIRMKEFLDKCYNIMYRTNAEIHPDKYLNMFTKMEMGVYPVFHGYPKTLIENQTKKFNNDLSNQLRNINIEEAKLLLNKKKGIDKMLNIDLENIEKKRLYEMQKACNKKLEEQQIEAGQYLRRLFKLNKKFEEHQVKHTKNKMSRKNLLTADRMLDEMETKCEGEKYLDEEFDTLLFKHYSELIKHKMQIEALLQREKTAPDQSQLLDCIRREHCEILREIKKISESPGAEKRIRQYNAISSLLAMDDLIKKVESALAKELSSEYLEITESESFLKNMQLQAVTEELEAEVKKLLSVLSASRLGQDTLKISSGNNIRSQSATLMRASKPIRDSEKKTRSCPLILPKNESSNISVERGSLCSKIYINKPNNYNKIKRLRKKVKNKSVRFNNSNKM